MTSYYVEMTFETGNSFNANMQAHLDQVAEQLADLTDVDADIGADLHAGRVDICITVTAEDRPAALVKAFVAARTAVHAAGGATGTWDGRLRKLLDADEYRSSVIPSALTDHSTFIA